jgi:hypothetical protein
MSFPLKQPNEGGREQKRKKSLHREEDTVRSPTREDFLQYFALFFIEFVMQRHRLKSNKDHIVRIVICEKSLIQQ